MRDDGSPSRTRGSVINKPLEDCNEAAVVTRRTADYTGVAWYAVDLTNAERLWDTALNLLSAGDPA